MADSTPRYYTEIGGDLKGIQGNISGGIVTQYIITQKSGIEIRSQNLIDGSPYKGLRNFEAVDKDKFFGRESWIVELTNHLQEKNILLLLGASGSGKSSLIQAGLIPKLKDQSGYNQLIDLNFVPDDNPFESFYGCLINNKYTQLEAKLARSVEEDTLIKVVEKLKQGSQWLIVIDQFEQLFTRTSKRVQEIFIYSLIQLTKNLDISVKIIFAMRADFLDKLSPYPDLGKIHDSCSRMLTDMGDTELRVSIAEPAARNGVIFQEGLIEQIIADFYQQPGSLPLLQFTLNELWDKEKENIQDRILNIKTYEDLGGVTGALQKHANKIYNKFDDPEQQKAAEQIFIGLIGLDQKEPVSIRADKTSFEKDKTQEQVLRQLIDARLLVSKEEDGKATVEVAHEALLRCWKVLQDLIQDKNDIIILLNRLSADAKQWDSLRQEDPQRANAELWSGSKLTRVKELKQEKSLPNLDTVPEEFIQASLVEVERVKQEKEEQQQKELETAKKLAQAQEKALEESKKREDEQKKSNKILFQGSILLAILSLCTTGLGLTAWNEKNQAELDQAESLGQDSLYQLNNHKELEAAVAAIKAGKILHSHNVSTPEVLTALEAISVQSRERNRLEGHSNPVFSVSFSPDGKILASGSADNKIKLWNVQTGNLMKTLQGHNNYVWSVSFSPDGKILASGSADNKIKLWNVQTGKLIKTLQGHSNPVNSVSFSPDGKTLASGSDDKTIKLWNVDNGKPIKTLQDHSYSVMSVSFSPDGKTLASGSADKTIKLWNVDNGKLIKTLQGHSNPVNSVGFSHDGKTLASGSLDDTIKLWNVDNGNLKKTLKGHSDSVSSVSFSPDGKTLASGSLDKTIKLWNVDNGNLIKTLQGHGNSVNSVGFSHDGKTLASGSLDYTIKLWNVDNGKLIKTLQDHSNAVNSVSFSPDGKTLASGSDDKTIKLWNVDNGDLMKTLQGHSYSVMSVSFSPDGKTLASGSDDKTIKLWNVDNGNLKKTLKGHSDSVHSVSFSPDGKTLASGSLDNTIKLWDVQHGNLKKTLKGHSNSVHSVSFSPDGKTLASGSLDNTIKLWDVQHGNLKKTLKGHSDSVNSVSFSPDGKILASGSNDKTIKLWDVQHDNLKKTLKGHNNYVISVSFSPDGKTLASGSLDNTIKLWDVQTSEENITLQGHSDSVWSVSFSPDGKTLASGSKDKTIKLWNLSGLDLISLIQKDCNYVHAYLESNPNVSESNRHLCDDFVTQQ